MNCFLTPITNYFYPVEEKIKTKYVYVNQMWMYQGAVLIYGKKNTKSDAHIFSYKMYELDYEKMNKLVKKHIHGGGYGLLFDHVEISEIENLLNEYLDLKNVKVMWVAKDVHQDNGYPYWCFGYNCKENKK